MFHCSLKIKGRIAVITGGGTGIGFMMATSSRCQWRQRYISLPRLLNQVYITGRRVEPLEESAAKLNAIGLEARSRTFLREFH